MDGTINLDEWRGLDALDKKQILGKSITIIDERDFPSKQTRNGKTFNSTVHIIYAIMDSKKIKIFGTGNLHKSIDAIRNKLPIDDSIEFVEGKGKYGHGYYKLAKNKPVFQKAPTVEQQNQTKQ